MHRLKKLLWFTPAAAAMIAVNLAGDPTSSASVDRVELLARRSVLEPVPYGLNTLEDRLFQVARASTPYSPEVLVLGSSRTMQIGAECFPGRRVYSAGVSAGDVPDMAAILQSYLENGKRPSEIVIGIDTFHLWRNPEPHWKAVAAAYWRWRTAAAQPPDPEVLLAAAGTDRLIRALSPFSFPAAWRAVLDSGDDGQRQLPAWRGVDGERIRVSEPRHWNAVQGKQGASDFLRHTPAAYRPFREIDPERARLLCALIDRARAIAQVRIWLAPYHPTAFDALEGRKNAVTLSQAEEWVRRIASERGLPVTGSYSPTRCWAGGKDFYDATHPRPGLVQRLFAVAREPRVSARSAR